MLETAKLSQAQLSYKFCNNFSIFSNFSCNLQIASSLEIEQVVSLSCSGSGQILTSTVRIVGLGDRMWEVIQPPQSKKDLLYETTNHRFSGYFKLQIEQLRKRSQTQN